MRSTIHFLQRLSEYESIRRDITDRFVESANKLLAKAECGSLFENVDGRIAAEIASRRIELTTALVVAESSSPSIAFKLWERSPNAMARSVITAFSVDLEGYFTLGSDEDNLHVGNAMSAGKVLYQACIKAFERDPSEMA